MARFSTLFSPVYITLLLATLTAVAVNAQSTVDFPPCAQSCVTAAAAASGCSQTDNACLCKSSGFSSATSQCAAKVCPKEDQASTNGLLQDMCSNPSPPPSSSSTSSTPPNTGSSTPPKPTPSNSSQSQSQSPSQAPPTRTTRPTSPGDTPNTGSPSNASVTPNVAAPGVTTGPPGRTLSLAPSSTEVVLSTITADLGPTGNAAPGQKRLGEGMGIVGAAIVGLIAFL